MKEVLETKEDNVVESTSAKTETIPTTTRLLTTKRDIEDNETPVKMRRRKVVRKKLKPKTSKKNIFNTFSKPLRNLFLAEEVKTNETVDENNGTTDTIPPPTVEPENVRKKEEIDSTNQATDDAQEDEEKFAVVKEKASKKERIIIVDEQIIEEEKVIREEETVEEEEVFETTSEIFEETTSRKFKKGDRGRRRRPTAKTFD